MSERPATEGQGAEGASRRVNRLGEQYRFGVVLLLLLATFICLMSDPRAAWIRPLTVSLQGATLLAAMAAARVPFRWQQAARVVVGLALALSVGAAFTHGDFAQGATAILSGVLVLVAPIAIAQSIVRRRVIDARTVLGALCIYVLLGLLWAFVYTAIGYIGSASFFAQQPHAASSDFVYFSFVTLTTTGYGDLTAATNVGRSLAVLEALLGQIYLVTIVALLVSNLGRSGHRTGDEA